MIIIHIKKDQTIESALRLYKNKVNKTGQIKKLRERESYTKPSVHKRTQKIKAVYVQKLKDGLI